MTRKTFAVPVLVLALLILTMTGCATFGSIPDRISVTQAYNGDIENGKAYLFGKFVLESPGDPYALYISFARKEGGPMVTFRFSDDDTIQVVGIEQGHYVLHSVSIGLEGETVYGVTRQEILDDYDLPPDLKRLLVDPGSSLGTKEQILLMVGSMLNPLISLFRYADIGNQTAIGIGSLTGSIVTEKNKIGFSIKSDTKETLDLKDAFSKQYPEFSQNGFTIDMLGGMSFTVQ